MAVLEQILTDREMCTPAGLFRHFSLEALRGDVIFFMSIAFVVVSFGQSSKVSASESELTSPNGGTHANAFAHVFTNILPSISITGGEVPDQQGTDNYFPENTGIPSNQMGSTAGIHWVCNVNLGSHSGTGFIEGWATFVVHSNVQEYGIGCSVSKLYKGGSPLEGGFEASLHDDPIEVYQDYGCYIDVANANPVGGGSKFVSFVESVNISGFAFRQSEIRRFHFNHPEPTQNVTLKVKWLQDDPAKRLGQYSGFIKLTTIIDY